MKQNYGSGETIAVVTLTVSRQIWERKKQESKANVVEQSGRYSQMSFGLNG